MRTWEHKEKGVWIRTGECEDKAKGREDVIMLVYKETIMARSCDEVMR